VEFQVAMPVQVPPPELEELLDELDDELLLEELEELLDDELELEELLDELEDEELELDELLDELDELLEPVVSHRPRSFHALVHAQPTPGS
jgi:hypothetical protein